jgi:hypothetical protein
MYDGIPSRHRADPAFGGLQDFCNFRRPPFALGARALMWVWVLPVPMVAFGRPSALKFASQSARPAFSQNRYLSQLQVMGHTLGSTGALPKPTYGSRADGSADFKNRQ